jgi:hypothetical protein
VSLASKSSPDALLDRLTRYASILTTDGDSDRLELSAGHRCSAAKVEQNQTTETIDF